MQKIKILFYLLCAIFLFNACHSAPKKNNCSDLQAVYLVYFNYSSAALNVKGFDTLKRVAAAAACCGKSIEINGHTDITGTVRRNKTLSRQRAQAVSDFLISLGVNADLININAYGYSSPLERGNNPSANAKNRRCEIFLK